MCGPKACFSNGSFARKLEIRRRTPKAVAAIGYIFERTSHIREPIGLHTITCRPQLMVPNCRPSFCCRNDDISGDTATMATAGPAIVGCFCATCVVRGQSVRFNSDIRPILADACFSCHGPDSAARQADLRLDRRDDAIRHTAIVPGDASSSELVRRVLSDDPEERMPPPETKKSLTKEQKDTLVRWIQSGAEYEPHWSLIPPTRPPLPHVKDGNWIRNPRYVHCGASGDSWTQTCPRG
jgi:hypothetical protein